MMTIILLLIFISSVNSIGLDIRYPQFFHQSLIDSSVEITEGKSAGSFIAFINFIDYPNIIPNEWSLNITETDFKIQSNGLSYSLVTTKTLDRERKSFYEFLINAQHLVPPYEKISKLVRIRILDINDCAPVFNHTIYETAMIPNLSSFTVHAYDCDEPNTDNSRITYSLANYQDLFHINETTGMIECMKNMNTYERYEIIVNARDHGKPSLSSSTLVQIQLISSVQSTNRLSTSSLWLRAEQNPQNIVILAGVLASLFVFISLFICLVCRIKYKLKRSKDEHILPPSSTTSTNLNNQHSILNEKPLFSSTSSTTSSNDLQQQTANGEFTRMTDDLHFERTAILYDAMNIFPNTYYLPLKRQTDLIENINNSNNNDTSLHLPTSSSSTSSPISATVMDVKAGSDDGCYCSSDMSSEQSNNLLLLNPSSLSTTNTKLSSKHVRFSEKHINVDGALKRFENLYGSRTASDHCASYV